MEDVSVIKKAAEMNAEHLLTHFDRIADAPDAIPRLRRFILDLAVRGKLVPQDPNDEPASELLKRIAAEKARLVKTGEIRNPKQVLVIDAGECFFSAPRGWEWKRLSEISLRSTMALQHPQTRWPTRFDYFGSLTFRTIVSIGFLFPGAKSAKRPSRSLSLRRVTS